MGDSFWARCHQRGMGRDIVGAEPIQIPKQLPTCSRPVRAADPNGKRTKALARRREKRKQALREELRGAREELHSFPAQNPDAKVAAPFSAPLGYWEQVGAARAIAFSPGGFSSGRLDGGAHSFSAEAGPPSHCPPQRNVSAQRLLSKMFATWVGAVERARLISS